MNVVYLKLLISLKNNLIESINTTCYAQYKNIYSSMALLKNELDNNINPFINEVYSVKRRKNIIVLLIKQID